ncbi:potassium-transporting ATPase subunit KdpC [Methylotenera mobilis]|uniref:Potassium-transporting ATPase KdpC subunit n=1 Tax=Methylotenera mobilis (strain JLW8 / ATCC BAA-1282 / DSM 17540) TaxID=583345 RepID=C6WWR0_METML|nr:potassium-transporting ATPase subunit KdpC [Methylotenera mobilis]ACT48359.1 potassium-transporting ATPase, C subunit [Methylotenera mobilis JLW8]
MDRIIENNAAIGFKESIKQTIRSAALLFVVLTIITGIVYPLVTTGIGQWLMPKQAGGSLIEKDGKLVGSTLIGQNFTEAKYFWGRPSATAPYPNNAAASTGSSLGPLNPALAEAVKGRVAALKNADPDNSQPIPVDLVTTSASGLDPHISPAAAYYQINRVAKARGLSPETVQALINNNTEGRQWGVLGEPRVNVLLLNIALDNATKTSAR